MPPQKKPLPLTKPKPKATPKIPFDLMDMSKEDRLERFTAFIYGHSGSGKTYMLRTLLDHPDLYPALVIVCDNGHLSLKEFAEHNKLELTMGSSYSDLLRIYDFLKLHPKQYKTVVIDNISELNRSILMAQGKSARTNRGNTSREDVSLTQQDYGITRNKILSIVADYAKELSINVIVTALANTIIDEGSSFAKTQPSLYGKLAFEAPGYFDLVAYLEERAPTATEKRAAQKAGKVLTNQRVLITQSNQTILQARIRGGGLPPETVDPDWPMLYNTLATHHNNK